ncbi:TPA: hypothetical protein DIU27_04540 [Candidatus Collierbacteria bacterium]|uniref:Spore protein YkvP/CgeB glycosyl transferase-like domain-containing protein n=1 Tax=Candidatus Collierbacteria bacterium GW2011_GWB2_44_22 TaxID=1618387 RepID=A0A0G1HX93_9BACT|nr:MAG: hypothetical protein UW31_C0013G0055 [Candidatus Collierbacteria bacterium GW2011_GWA2_44_13]KKT50129.1 MAG: hypothetical protein UW42_C0024G0027 [Candidatus Collierbacteria bacterium GW2011_GWB1_44_197]KKT51736.1 MAG: hypothetical protein UW44_C0008G0058 [Candidatus Collierbacteria bacterium GW2011_GWB2_44_22]KKT62533.1 MAG: hypothetical protein UW56_C0006G0056 [Candidatus Collierbacteria bacterium GW2011_GWD1_44_27]KKT66955.1 MAG: hypothetical protein UW58_C0001G0059 [Candidatus Colli
MKILFCTFHFPDYGLDTLYSALYEHLGAENIFEYPEKGILHGEKHNRYVNYPNFFQLEKTRTDAEKFEMLKRDEFDYLLVGCRAFAHYTYHRNRNRHYDDDFYALLKEKSLIVPTILVDQGDDPGINHDLIKELHAKLYFKREFKKENALDRMIIPFNFSYPEVPHDIHSNYILDVFWAGKVNPSREPYVLAAEELLNTKFYNRYRQSAYRKTLAEYKIGLNLKGLGDDTVRYYEIPAYGALLFSQKLSIVIENDFKDGETAIFFDGIDEMKEKLLFCLHHERYVDKIRLAGYRWFTKYHSNKVRATQFMEKIQQVTQ